MENFEDKKNHVIRNEHNEIISANGYVVGDYVVFERSKGAPCDTIHRIEKFFEHRIFTPGPTRSYIKFTGGLAPIDDFFFRGYRKATLEEIADYE